VASFDRLSRDQIDLALVKRWFGRYGVLCVSAAGESNGAEGPIAELIDRVLGAIHEFERKRILERVAAGKAERKRAGRFVHGAAPYGFTIAPAANGGKTLQPDETKVETVQRIFELTSYGKSPGRIAAALNREDVPGPSGGSWNRQTIRNIITNSAYTGELHGIKNAHPAIVSRRRFNAAQRALEARRRPA
jgi:site-specific DNA recombinase